MAAPVVSNSMKENNKLVDSEVVFKQKGALRLIKKDEAVPQGAIRMTKGQIYKIHEARLNKWKPESEIWPFKIGDTVFGIGSVLSASIIHFHMRKKFRLGRIGHFLSYMIVVGLPAVFSSITQKLFVMEDLLTVPVCPTCLEVRSGVVQVMTGVAYPFLQSMILSIYQSRQHGTHLGKGSFQPGFYHAFQSSFAARNSLMMLVFANFGLGFYLTYLRGRCVENTLMQQAKMLTDGMAFADD